MGVVYRFDNRLVEGIIKSRPNRFIMNVMIDNKMYRCHCPVTTRIGEIVMDNIPCLLSKQPEEWNRETQYNVEAISLDDRKTWIGINQLNSNTFVEYFMRAGCLKELTGPVDCIKREVPYHNSKLDLEVNHFFVEIKSPLGTVDWPLAPDIKLVDNKTKIYSQRFDKHLTDLRFSLETNKQAYLLVCFQYDRPPFKLTEDTVHANYMAQPFREAIKAGVQIWQCNMLFHEDGIEFKTCFNLTDYYKKFSV